MKEAIRRAQDTLVEKHMTGENNPILRLKGHSGDYVTYNRMWRYIDLYTKLLMVEMAKEFEKLG